MRGDSVTTRYRSAMQNELAANESKGDWLARPMSDQVAELRYHVAKLRAAVACDLPDERILEFAADVGNHAMFVADKRLALGHRQVAARAAEQSYVMPPLRFYVVLTSMYPRAITKLWRAWRYQRPVRLAAAAATQTRDGGY